MLVIKRTKDNFNEFPNFSMMEESSSEDEKRITSWETYKILSKIKENVQLKRKVAKDVLVLICLFPTILVKSLIVSPCTSQTEPLSRV